MPTDVVVEGPDDAAVLASAAPDLKVHVPKEGGQGRDRAMKEAALIARAVGENRVALVLDLDGQTAADILDEVAVVAQGTWHSAVARSGPWLRRAGSTSAVRVVPAGLSLDSQIAAFGVRRFAMDDYILKLFLADPSLAAYCEREKGIEHRPANAAALIALLTETTQTLRGRGITIDTSKRLLDLVDAILGIRCSYVTRDSDLVRRCPPDVRQQVLGELLRNV